MELKVSSVGALGILTARVEDLVLVVVGIPALRSCSFFYADPDHERKYISKHVACRHTSSPIPTKRSCAHASLNPCRP